MTAPLDTPKTGFAHALHAEWVKFRTLRSSWYTLACLGFVGLGVATLSMSAAGAEYASATPAERLDWDPAALSLRTYLVAQLIIGVLGILVVTSEHATGLIRTSLAAVPRRPRLLAAKAILVAVVAAIAGQALMFASFFIGRSLLAAEGTPHANLGDRGVLSAVTGGGLYLTALAMLATGLAVVLRTTAGALATLVGVVFLVPALSNLFPSWTQSLFDFWPSLGGAAVISTVPDPAYPHPWLNLGGMCLGVAVVLAAAFALFRHRDV